MSAYSHFVFGLYTVFETGYTPDKFSYSMLRHYHHKVKTHHKHPDGKTFAHLGLLVGLGNGAFWTIFPLVLENTVRSEAVVGGYYALLSVVGLLASLLSTAIFTKYSKISILKYTFLLSIIILGFLTFATNIWHIAGLDIPRAVCVILTNIALALFINEFAKRSELAYEEGRYYLYANIGWLIGPLLGGYSAKFFGNESAFIAASGCYLVALLYFLHQHLVMKHPHIHHDSHDEGLKELWLSIRKYFGRRELVKVFLVGLGLNFWWQMSGIYIPIAVEEMGYSQDIVGWVISGGILPLVLLETWVGKMAQKYTIRVFLILGFFLLSAFTLSFALVDSSPMLLLILFAAVNIGAALIEPLKETYFFEVVTKKESEKLFGIYNTSWPAGNIIAPFFAVLVFLTADSFRVLWIATAVVFLGFALFSVTVSKKY